MSRLVPASATAPEGTARAFLAASAATTSPSQLRGQGTVMVSMPASTTQWVAMPVVLGTAAAVSLGSVSHKWRGSGRSALSKRLQRSHVIRTAAFFDYVGGSEDTATNVSRLELASAVVAEDITQFRLVHGQESQRYGEEYSRKLGSTDNLYLIAPELPGASFVLIGTGEAEHAEVFFKQYGVKFLDQLGHLVLQFFDGRQAGFIEALINARPESLAPLEVHCTVPIVLNLKKNLSSSALERCVLRPVKNGSTLPISEARVLKFVLTPTTQLPEALVAFDPLTGTLFSGKFFSCHRAITAQCNALDSRGSKGWEFYAADWFHFFDNYFFTRRAQRAIRKIFMLAESMAGPDVEQLAPLHGPVVREQCWKLMAKYEAWTEQKLRKESRRDQEVLLMFASAYGHTKALAMGIAKSLKSSGVRINDIDLEHTPMNELSHALDTCDGFLIGSPTLGGEMPTQVKEALGVVLSRNWQHKLPCGVFGSYGWSGEAVDELEVRLKDAGFPMAFDPIRSRFRPTKDILKRCEEAGVRMSQKLDKVLLERKRSRARNVAGTEAVKENGLARDAFGKMRTSQCVLTSLDASGKDTVTLVSWVNQASFSPAAVTMAITNEQIDLLLTQSLEEQLRSLYESADDDGNNEMSRDEAVQLLRALFGFGGSDELSPKQQESIDASMLVLDADGDGDITFEEFQAAASDGPLAELLQGRRRSMAVERALQEGFSFVLNMVPSGESAKDLIENAVPHKKVKASNGCRVLGDSHAFIECSVTQAIGAGDHTLLYAEVRGGKVLVDSVQTSTQEASGLVPELREVRELVAA